MCEIYIEIKMLTSICSSAITDSDPCGTQKGSLDPMSALEPMCNNLQSCVVGLVFFFIFSFFFFSRNFLILKNNFFL